MHIFNTMDDWRHTRKTLPANCSLGFVPTMGTLHSGHASLFKQSMLENDVTAVSIFINPTQFNQREDFLHYPRTRQADLDLLTSIGVDYCLLPDEAYLYADNYRYQVDEKQYSNHMEGVKRPGHFTGMLTVVMKLLNLAKPQRAYFGEKDYQQLQLIRGMVEAFFMDIDIIACPTIREASGLAYSSRNQRLTPKERILADQFATLFHQNKSCQEIINALNEHNILVDYIEEHDNRRFAAVCIGDVRLIDNWMLDETACSTKKRS